MQLRRLTFAFLAIFCVTSAQAQFVHTQGKEIVDGAGKPLLLRGINVGNWFVPEGYMWQLNEGGPESPREIEALSQNSLVRSGPTISGATTVITTSRRRMSI